MDWGKYLFYRFNAASGINMKEMSVHLKPLIRNVPLLSCATEPHFCCSLSQLSQKRSALNAIVHFFSWGWKQSSCKRHFHIHPLPATKGSEAFAPCLCEMLRIPECFFAIWNHIHKCEFVFLRCWGDGLLPTRGNPFLMHVLRACLPLWRLIHLTNLLAARSSSSLKFLQWRNWLLCSCHLLQPFFASSVCFSECSRK